MCAVHQVLRCPHQGLVRGASSPRMGLKPSRAQVATRLLWDERPMASWWGAPNASCCGRHFGTNALLGQRPPRWQRGCFGTNGQLQGAATNGAMARPNASATDGAAGHRGRFNCLDVGRQGGSCCRLRLRLRQRVGSVAALGRWRPGQNLADRLACIGAIVWLHIWERVWELHAHGGFCLGTLHARFCHWRLFLWHWRIAVTPGTWHWKQLSVGVQLNASPAKDHLVPWKCKHILHIFIFAWSGVQS